LTEIKRGTKIRLTINKIYKEIKMILVSLIYVSTFKKNIDPSELANIHKKSEANNSKNNITGMMIFGDDYFIQCLEGERNIINHIYSKILIDPRHENLILLEYNEIHEREFEDWSMRLILLTSEKLKHLMKFSTSISFNPYQLSATSARKLLLSLKIY